MDTRDFDVIAKIIRGFRGELSVDDFMFVLETVSRVFQEAFPNFDRKEFENFILR